MSVNRKLDGIRADLAALDAQRQGKGCPVCRGHIPIVEGEAALQPIDREDHRCEACGWVPHAVIRVVYDDVAEGIPA